MGGYRLRLTLYSEVELWREIEIPDDITFERLHFIIQKLFGFQRIHMWEFRIPRENSRTDEVDLNDIVRTVNTKQSLRSKVKTVLRKQTIIDYEYDFGDGWEIIIQKLEDTNYKNKTALILDYEGRYNPMDDMGGIMVYEEIMEEVNNGEDIYDVADSYGIEEYEVKMYMDFEEKYEKGSRIRLNDREWVLSKQI